MRRAKHRRRHRAGMVLPRVLVGISVAVYLGGVTSRSQAAEQEVIAAGQREFQRSCATCHGTDAKGGGPLAGLLLAKPADLTQLSKNHGGTFLFWRIYDKIEGSDEDIIRGHGTREMPIWGERFRLDRETTAEYQMGVRGRILSLVHYLESIQEK